MGWLQPNRGLRALLVICDLISNPRTWNNCPGNNCIKTNGGNFFFFKDLLSEKLYFLSRIVKDLKSLRTSQAIVAGRTFLYCPLYGAPERIALFRPLSISKVPKIDLWAERLAPLQELQCVDYAEKKLSGIKKGVNFVVVLRIWKKYHFAKSWSVKRVTGWISGKSSPVV